eukprot:1153419-Pelagomonas_calceolata.AAC.4
MQALEPGALSHPPDPHSLTRTQLSSHATNDIIAGGYIWGYERNLWDDLRFTPTLQRGDGRGLTRRVDQM